jgi:lysylphosphatidylglycerol synthetase-like protein (DUF2156 family)
MVTSAALAAATPDARSAVDAGASFAAYGRNPGCQLFTSDSGRAYVAYRRWNRYVVALGGPGGEPEELDELRGRFRDWAGADRIAWYGASRAENAKKDVYADSETSLGIGGPSGSPEGDGNDGMFCA